MAAPPPKKPVNPWTIIGWIVVIAIFVPCVGCGAVVGITALGKSTTSTTVAANPRAGGTAVAAGPGVTAVATTVPPEVGGDKVNPVPIGTVVVPAKDWELAVTAVTPTFTNTVFAAKPGSQYVAVSITTTNKSTKPESFGSNFTMNLLPTSGVAIDRSYTCMTQQPDDLDSSAEMQPGATVTGRICFEVPTAQVAGAVLLAQPQFTVDKVKDQRFLALA